MGRDTPRPPSRSVPGDESGHAPAAGPADPRMTWRRSEPRLVKRRPDPGWVPARRYPGMSFGRPDPGMAGQQADLGIAAPRAGPLAATPAKASWIEVFGTTLRRLLWWDMSRKARDAGSSTWRRPVGALVLVVIVLMAGAVTVELPRPAGEPPGSRAMTARAAAAAWVEQQVSRAAIIACDPVMCAALQASGLLPSNLLALGPGAADPRDSTMIVATPALQSQFGSRLAAVYAPAVIASFGSGASRVDIRVTGPDGAAAYRAALAADLAARRATEKLLLGNWRFSASAAARRDLVAGSVDSRLLMTLATLAAGQYVHVVAFGDAAPGADLGMPLRSARLTIPHLVKNPGTYLQAVLGFLRAQNAPFRAASARVTRVGGKVVLQIDFAAPSPLGLLGKPES